VLRLFALSVLVLGPASDPEALLAEGRLGLARDALERRLSAEPDDWRSLNALAITLAQQGLGDQARAAIDRAHRVRPDRAEVVNNLASLALASGDGPRAVRVLGDFLRAHRNEPPEFLVHAFTIALARSSEPGRASRSLAEARQLHEALVARLESSRPGRRLHGVTWLDASLVEARERTSDEAVDRVRELVDARAKLQAQSKQLDVEQRRLGLLVERQQRDPLELDAIERDIAVNTNRLERNAAAIVDAFEQIALPAVPLTINLRLTDGTEMTDDLPTGAPTSLSTGIAVGPRAVIADARTVASARRVELHHADGQVMPAAVRRVDPAGWALLETQSDLASLTWDDALVPGSAEAWTVVESDADAPRVGSIGCELVIDGQGLSLTWADEPPAGMLALARDGALIGLALSDGGSAALIASDGLADVRRVGARKNVPVESVVWLVASWNQD
jgi:hypothetical protein